MMGLGRETGHARPQRWPNADYLVSVTFEVYSREYDIIVNSCIRKNIVAPTKNDLHGTYHTFGRHRRPIEICDASLRVRTVTTVTILTP